MEVLNRVHMKFILVSTVILIIALVVTMLISTNEFSDSVTGFAKDDLKRTAEENSQYISNFYDDQTRLCVAVSETDLIIQGCLDQAGDLRGNQANPTYHNYGIEANPERWEELTIYLNRMWTYWQDKLENMFLGDIYGYAHVGAFEVIDIPTSGIPMNIEGRGGNYWARAIEGEISYGDLEESPVPTHDFLASGIAVPVKDSNGKVCGLAGVPADFRSVQAFIENNKVGDTGYTLLIDRYGRILVHPNSEYALHGMPEGAGVVETYLNDLDGTGWDDIQKNMVAQKSGFDTFKQDGKKYHIYYDAADPVGQYTGMGLSVASIISDSELNEEANSMRNTIILLIIVTLVISILLTYLVAARITSPIRKLTAAADKISLGDFDVSIDVKSKDEIGELAESFKRMLTSVRFLSEDEGK